MYILLESHINHETKSILSFNFEMKELEKLKLVESSL